MDRNMCLWRSNWHVGIQNWELEEEGKDEKADLDSKNDNAHRVSSWLLPARVHRRGRGPQARGRGRVPPNARRVLSMNKITKTYQTYTTRS
jgi:hypothetical protein